MKFDVVYTWVDGSDPEYMAKCKSYANKKKDTNPERFRDNFDLIKFSFRSLEQHFDRFNKVFLLTARPQVPDWIDREHPRLEIVHHDQVIPERYLPTFNPNVIESFLHRIPGLGDHFLYMNDDFLFGDTVPEGTFYRGGKYRIFNTLWGENLSWRVYDGHMDIIGLGIIEHSPMLVNKDYWEEAVERYPGEMHQTRVCRFREDTNLFPYKLYRYNMLKYHREESDPIMVHNLLKEFTFHKLTNNLAKQRKFIRTMKQKRPKYYCMNDDLGDSPDPRVVSMISEYLDETYPVPSQFEG